MTNMNKRKAKEFQKRAKEILSRYPLCNRCLQRQFQKVKLGKQKTAKPLDCYLCKGIFEKIDEIAVKVIEVLDKQEAGIHTFLIGTSITKGMEAREEKLWEEIPLEKAESIKAKLNREIGKAIERKSKYEFSIEPEVRAIYGISTGKVNVQITPVYVFGKYKKLKRGIRQTKKAGTKEESVEELIERPFSKESEGKRIKFHSSGREDIDALMLGDGRPFIVEIIDPKKRKLNLKKIRKEVNKKARGKVEIRNLKFATKNEIEIIKRARFDKTYQAIVETSKNIKKEDLEKIKPTIIFQKTPERVLVRRADITRKRRIKEIKTKFINKRKFELILTAEAGTYIKEFINGDNGRTTPSIAEMLGTASKCIELNVLRIHSGWYEDFW